MSGSEFGEELGGDPVGEGATDPGGADGENNSKLPNSPTKKLQFGIYAGKHFNPLYHPERIVVTTEKELNRIPAGCEGQEVVIKQLKNSDISIVGKMHSEDLSTLQDVAEYDGEAEIISPILKGGMNTVIKSTEYGEILGWDAFPAAEDWLMNYKIDVVSTGEQEYGSGAESSFTE
jgi:hypothetical protein